MSSKYSGYLSDHRDTPPSYKRDFSSPLPTRKSEFLSLRPSLSSYSSSNYDSKPPLFGTSYGSSSRSSQFGTSYSPLSSRSSIGSSSYSPSTSQRTYSNKTTFNRSTSNDFGVSYSPKTSNSSRTSGISDHSRNSSTNLTPFESRYSSSSSGTSRSSTTSNTNSRPTYTSSYSDTDYNVNKSNKTNEANNKEKFRILTSRASSPNAHSRTSTYGMISDTQAEKYPLTDTTRRRQLKNAITQVDPNDTEDSQSHSPSKTTTADQILPKQSGFVPKNRSYRFQSKSDAEDERPRPPILSRPDKEKSKETPAEELVPKQSSFLKKLKPDDIPERQKLTPKPIIGTTVSLKESIEKVKTWKKQMQDNLDFKDDDDDVEWRKQMNFDMKNGGSKNEKGPPDRSGPSTSSSNSVASDNECTRESVHSSDKSKTNQQGVSGFLRKASSHASLPDLVESAEKSRENNAEMNKTFIGRMKDIDSLLDFEDSTGEAHEFDESQVSSWVEDDFKENEDIDDLLDGDLGSSSYSAGQSAGPVKKTRSTISNNPFIRQMSSMTQEPAYDEGSDDDEVYSDPSRCKDVIRDLLRELESTGDQLPVQRLVDKCQLTERSVTYRRLQNKLKAEQKFTGFETVKEVLEFLKVNVAQLENCAVLLYNEWKSKHNMRRETKKILNCLLLQSSFDHGDDDDDDDEHSVPNDLSIKMAVRVHALVDFLAKGKELRRVLFSLKRIFKNESDCIKEFIYSDGLINLIKIAEENSSNSTYQCYILRVIGQLMLNVDGMNGIVSINKVIQWLYQLTGSSSPLVSRTALRLLIVFISYSECNSFLFIQAVSSVSLSKGRKTFSNLMEILKKTTGSNGGKEDPCLLVLILVNKMLESVPDQDSFYDVVDSLAEQGLDKIFWTKTSYGSAKPEFVDQMKNFENMIKQEDVRQLEQKQPSIVTDNSNNKEWKRIQSRNSSRRSVYYMKRDDVLQKEISRRNAVKQANQQKLIKEFEGNKISNAELDKNSSDFKKDLQEGTFSGLIGKAKDGLIMSQAASSKSPSNLSRAEVPVIKTEGQLRWEEAEGRALERLKRNELRLAIKEIDFSDVTEVDEVNYLDIKPQPTSTTPDPKEGPKRYGAQPLPPSCPPGGMPLPPPPPPIGMPAPPGLPPLHPPGNIDKKESSKTLKLHWKEARSEFPLPSGRMGDTVWSRICKEIGSVKIDKEEFGRLFHSKAAEIKIKSESHKKELALLDSKRSNMINIALTALPQQTLIKTAILNMDQTILTKEAVEKLLTLLPGEEEKTKLIEAQLAQPDVPLGPAEQFLLMVSSISEVMPRLKLWLFMLDFDSTEGEISDALSDLRQAMEQMKTCYTLKYALAVLLAVGNCLNSSQARGFTLDFLSKVPDIKDSVKKRSLLHHLVSFVIQFYSDATDIFTEIGAVTRCSRVDWDELEEKLKKMEDGCKASWDYIRAIVKHDNNISLKNKLSCVLADFAERTLMLKMIHRRLKNRFRKFLLHFGYQPGDINSGSEVKVNQIFKVVSSFALEWRTTRTKILHTKKKKEVEKERKMNSSSMLNLSRSTHGSVSADESTGRSMSSKPPLIPLSNNNNNNNNKYNTLLSPAPKFSKWPSSSSIGYASETESAYETGDEELFGAVVRSATASPSSQKRQSRGRRASIDKSSSWRSSSRDRNGY